MHKLVLLRHGQSQWNLENRFTGWHDVDLTDQGRGEARSAGQVLHRGYPGHGVWAYLRGRFSGPSLRSPLKKSITACARPLQPMAALHLGLVTEQAVDFSA